ncbi:gliding motility-associated C-terminal domain-containing protein [Elusimicrobiota bacterium]
MYKKKHCFLITGILAVFTAITCLPGAVYGETDGINVYAGAAGSTDIYRSEDGGETWDVSVEAEDLDNAVKIWDIRMDSGGNVYAAVENDNGGEIYMSGGDDEWTRIAEASDLGDAAMVESIELDSSGNLYATVDGDDFNISIYKSNSKKDEWEEVFNNDDGIVIYDLHIDEEGNVYAILEGAGDYEGFRILISEDEGKTWESFAKREKLGDIACWQDTHADLIAVDSDGTVFTGTTDSSVYKQEASESNWTEVADINDLGGDGWISSLIIDEDDNIYVSRAPAWGVGSCLAAVYVSDDGGSTWEVSGDTITNGSDHFQAHSPDSIAGLSYDEDGSIYAAADTPGVIYKKEEGDDWEVIATKNTSGINNGVTGFTVICAFENKAGGETVVTIDPGKDKEITHELSDGSEVKIKIDAGTFDEKVDITIEESFDVPAIPSSQKGNMETIGNAVIIRFTNNARAGTKFNKPVTIYMDAVGEKEADAKLITMASYSTGSGTKEWTLLPSEYSMVRKVVRVKGETTHFTTFQLMKLSPADKLDVKAYPNPFKPGTSGDFNAAQIMFTGMTEDFSIKIFDISGGLVYEDDRSGSGGNYSWDAKNSAGEDIVSGIYIYVIEDTEDSKTVTGKICIIR